MIPEGWGVLRPGITRAHYFRRDKSLCQKVGQYRGPLTEQGPRLSLACRPCLKIIQKELNL